MTKTNNIEMHSHSGTTDVKNMTIQLSDRVVPIDHLISISDDYIKRDLYEAAYAFCRYAAIHDINDIFSKNMSTKRLFLRLGDNKNIIYIAGDLDAPNIFLPYTCKKREQIWAQIFIILCCRISNTSNIYKTGHFPAFEHLGMAGYGETPYSSYTVMRKIIDEEYKKLPLWIDVAGIVWSIDPPSIYELCNIW